MNTGELIKDPVPQTPVEAEVLRKRILERMNHKCKHCDQTRAEVPTMTESQLRALFPDVVRELQREMAK